MTKTSPTPRTRVKRGHTRAAYDQDTIFAILDAGYLAHVSCIVEGAPYVAPTTHWRDGDKLYWHGSTKSKMVKAALGGEVCVNVAMLDGFVMARSAFHHSVNYRSVTVFGQPKLVEDRDEKIHQLKLLIDRIAPGRWETLRPMTDQELKATAVLELSLNEASAKLRAEGVGDDEADYALPIWAGVVPVGQVMGTPEPDPRNLSDVPLPDHIKAMVTDA